MKIFKTLSKRGLALFLVLTMCVSLLPAAALAAEVAEASHVHNKDGWTCVEESRLICGYEQEHTHDENCWGTSAASGDPVCGLEESAGHRHDESCYTEETVLTCGQEESEEHQHDETCYTTEAVLTCGQEETEGHTHGEDCFAAGEKTLVCGLEEHEHSDECYESVWTCTQPTADVTRFLQAVKAIPEEITAQNVEEAEARIAEAIEAYQHLGGQEKTNNSVVKAYDAILAAEIAVEAAKGGSGSKIPEGAAELSAASLWKYARAYNGRPMNMPMFFGLVQTDSRQKWPASLTFVGKDVDEEVLLEDAITRREEVTVTANAITFDGETVSVYYYPEEMTSKAPSWYRADGMYNITDPENTVAVTFQFVDEKGNSLADDQILVQGSTANKPLSFPNAPKKNDGENAVHYRFDKWVDEDGNEVKAEPNLSGYTGSMTVVKVKPQYVPCWYVTFKDDKGVYDTVAVDVTEANPTGSIAYEKAATAEANYLTDAEHTLAGWALNGETVWTVGGTNEALPVTGDMVLTPVLTKGQWVTFDSQGGSYVPQGKVENGQVVQPADPTKEGFTFLGWYENAEYTGNAVTFPYTGTATTLYAKWQGAPVGFTVIYWQENPDFKNTYAKNPDSEHYSFIASQEVAANAGYFAGDKVGSGNFKVPVPSKVTSAIATGFDKTAHVGVLNAAQEVTDGTVTLSGDGSSIVNVYYNRETYNVRFRPKQTCSGIHGIPVIGHTLSPDCYDEDISLRITAKYGADIESGWPGGFWKIGASSTTTQGSLYQMPAGGDEFYGPPKTGNSKAKYYVEVLPGETGTEQNGKYKFHHEDGTTGGTVSKEDRYEIPGFVCNTDLSSTNGTSFGKAKFYYDRLSYNINFIVDGKEAKTVSLKYEQRIPGNADYIPGADLAKGRIFEGWYLDETGTKSADAVLSGKMPNKDITVYAKWKTDKSTVKVYASIHTDAASKPFEVEVGHAVDQDALNQFLTDSGKKLSDLRGWYTKNAQGGYEPYNLSDQVTGNIELYALWYGENYAVTYQDADGTQIDVDEGYSPNPNGNPASAPVKAYTVTAKNFDHWVDGAGNIYYPGGTVPVPVGGVTLKAVMKDASVTKVKVTYHSNFGTQEETKTSEEMVNNATFKVAANSWTREGYNFLGWATSKTATTAEFVVGADARADHAGVNDLYAVWQQVFSLTYNANGGNDNSVPVDANTYLKDSKVTLNSTTIPTHATVKVDGKDVKVVFIGWTAVKDGKIYAKGETAPETITEVTMSSAKTVYAVWGYDTNDNDKADVTETWYGLTYDANGGAGAPVDANTYLKDSKVTLNSTTIPTHATVKVDGKDVKVVFIGWTAAKDGKIYAKGETAPETITEVTMSSAKTVYAVWGYDTNDNNIPDV